MRRLLHCCRMNGLGFPRPMKVTAMTHDSDYFRRRAAEARAAAFRKDHDEDAEVAGQLALAYSALARGRPSPAAVVEPSLEILED